MALRIVNLMPGEAGDLCSVAALELVAWGAKPTAQEIELRKQRIEREMDQLDPSAKGISVATEGEVVVGICRVTQSADDEEVWMISGLAVHPEHRRQGIGRALVEASIRFAQFRGAVTIRSQAHADNLASIAFHRSVGFGDGCRFTASDGDETISYSMRVGE